MKKNWLLNACLVPVLLLSACGTESSSGEERKQGDLGGTLEFYTSQPDEDVTKLIEGFNRKYPDVEVKAFRSGTEEVVGKVQAEKRAGDVKADVMLVADSVTFEKLKEQDLLLSYKSKEIEHIPDDFADDDYMYTGTKMMATVLAVNTTNVKEPKETWSVLTDKKTKGKAVMPSPLYSGAAAYNVGVMSRQKKLNWNFFDELKKNDMTVVQGNGAALKAVASGQKDYGLVVDYLALRAEKEGSPIELIYPKEGVPVITEPVGIMEGTKNEKAAKAFVDYILSEEGQKLSADLGYAPIRQEIEAPDGLKSMESIQILDSPLSELYKSREEDKERFKRIFRN
jgi:iron(III) transport system substrate-binding protein